MYSECVFVLDTYFGGCTSYRLLANRIRRRQLIMRNLIIVLGDQLDLESAAFDGFDRQHDLVWMAEVPEESTHVPAHKARSALFLTAMRHFAAALRQRRFAIRYLRLGQHSYTDFSAALGADIGTHKPQRLVVVQPGEYRVLDLLERVATCAGVPLEVRPDRHFMIDLQTFDRWSEGRKGLRLEHFYRYLRQRHDILMDGRRPVGGNWNYDKENRKSFGKRGPGAIRPPICFPADRTARDVFEDVERHFGNNPGSLAHFDWPVTAHQAEQALADFIQHRLPVFGPYQDACWHGEPYLYHSRLSAAMNLKLISPKRVIDAAVEAYQRDEAPLASVEGFIRQVLGWREFVRGIYWRFMPDYLQLNSLEAEQPLPDFYWTGNTEMRCLSATIGQTLEYGYAHHIQRLMITGLFALLLGVRPHQVHEWYLAIYVDAVEWVELPNVLGMSQFADGGLMSSKPYVASGKYIQRMSNYCTQCRFDPADSTGDNACPFTTLYWDFLIRHQSRFAKHPRAGLQWRNLNRLSSDQLATIAHRAEILKTRLAAGSV